MNWLYLREINCCCICTLTNCLWLKAWTGFLNLFMSSPEITDCLCHFGDCKALCLAIFQRSLKKRSLVFFILNSFELPFNPFSLLAQLFNLWIKDAKNKYWHDVDTKWAWLLLEIYREMQTRPTCCTNPLTRTAVSSCLARSLSKASSLRTCFSTW